MYKLVISLCDTWSICIQYCAGFGIMIHQMSAPVQWLYVLRAAYARKYYYWHVRQIRRTVHKL